MNEGAPCPHGLHAPDCERCAALYFASAAGIPEDQAREIVEESFDGQS